MRQKGFTLVELLLALTVSSVVLVGATLSVQQVVLGTDRSNSQVVMLADINQAALAIRKDLTMTQYTDLADGYPVPESSVRLSWTDYTTFTSENATNHASTYNLVGTELQRAYDGTMGVVGRNITSVGFTQDGRIVNVVITATGPGASQRSETLEFSVYLRTEGIVE